MIKNDPLYNPIKLDSHMVPGIWRYMLPKEIFAWRIPEERRSTCLDCPQIPCEGYRPDYRCCTFNPMVPNYSLGMALTSQTGAPIVKRMLKEGYLLPEGSVQTPAGWYTYLSETKNGNFGKSKKVNCQFLAEDTGFCNIYAFRNSVCSTFYCMNDHGEKGSKFWSKVQEFVNQVETSLSQWSLSQIGFDVDAYFNALDKAAKNFSPLTKSKAWPASLRKELFQDWHGREEELFKACAKVVDKNRDELWSISKNFDIAEAEHFEKKQIAAVPRPLKSEVDDDEYVEGPNAQPSELWRSLKSSYKKLWKSPEQKIRLNPKVELVKNDGDTDEENHFKEKRPWILNFLTKKNADTYEWRNYLDKKEKKLLEKFDKPRRISPKLLRSLAEKNIKNPEEKIIEWIGKKVLIPAPRA